MEPKRQLLWGLVALWRGFQAESCQENNLGFVLSASSLGNIKNSNTEPPPPRLLVSSKSWVKCFHQLLVGLSCKCGTSLNIAPGSVFRVWWVCFVTPKLCPPPVFSLAWPVQRELTEPIPAPQPAAFLPSSRCFNCPLLYCKGLSACTGVLECICMCNLYNDSLISA